ncbi:MAG: ATP-binding cassette domain-containing protein, partial [Bacteroidota bacterium]
MISIRDLKCAYNGKDVVVHIKSLDIPPGEFVGLLSVSGGGKSTTLETLGLMNKTFLPGSTVTLQPDADGPAYDYETLWKNANAKEIAAVRSRYFSFIFQRTNLMPNFTAYENICITQMLQGKSMAEATTHAREVMALMGLKKVDEAKKAHELSGGEQQRVAFVRAITPDFRIIFGDEPTGNLDEENAQALMGKLHDKVKEQSRTAVIVSHDLDLISRYADRLIVLQKRHKTGECFPEHIFRCDTDSTRMRTWRDHEGQPVNDLT